MINYKQLFLDHHGANLDTNFKGGYDFELSVETTTDDYELYLCKYYDESIVIAENIYYYAHNLAEKLKEMIEEGLNIYCDAEIYDECYIDDEWVQWCEDEDLIELDEKGEWKVNYSDTEPYVSVQLEKDIKNELYGEQGK